MRTVRMTIGERDQFNRFIRALEGISGELKGIRRCLEKTTGDGGEKTAASNNSRENENDHRED